VKILSIETSCDETAIAIVSGEDKPKVELNLVSSQIELHKITNGIVPEVAARAQLEAIIPMIAEAKAAGASAATIDAIAVTYTPGLIGSLIVGVEAAKTLGALWQKPVYGIHHLEGHIYAAFSEINSDEVEFPVLALVVSGGHTELILMEDHFKYQIIGSTRDDAAGEAFDKIARLLGLGYPGGPEISKAAALYQDRQAAYPEQTLNFPRPMINDKSLDFSFSGLKTAVLYKLPEKKLSNEEINHYAYEAELAIIDVLVAKTTQALEQTAAATLVVAGGVSANEQLRKRMKQLGEDNSIKVIIPNIAHTTDNAAMIGLAAWHRNNVKAPLVKNFEAKPRTKLDEISLG